MQGPGAPLLKAVTAKKNVRASHMYTYLFWIGFLVILYLHIKMIPSTHAFVTLAALAMMFTGSKLGRAFLGIED